MRKYKALLQKEISASKFVRFIKRQVHQRRFPPNCTSSQTDVVPIDAEASAAVSQQADSNCSTLLASPPPFTHNSPINGLGEGKSCLLSDLRISNSV